jgi:alkylhydroperoxidase family enzyme
MVDAVLEDYRTAPIDDRERALFAFIEQMNERSSLLRREDVNRVIAAGWTEEAIYDAITVCALFKFYNAWIDATGVHDLPASAYEMSGKRMAAEGYDRSAPRAAVTSRE